MLQVEFDVQVDGFIYLLLVFGDLGHQSLHSSFFAFFENIHFGLVELQNVVGSLLLFHAFLHNDYFFQFQLFLAFDLNRFLVFCPYFFYQTINGGLVCQLSLLDIDETPLCFLSPPYIVLQFLFYLSLLLHRVQTDDEFFYFVDVSVHTAYFFVPFFFEIMLLFLLYSAHEHFFSISGCAQIGEGLVVAGVGFVHGGEGVLEIALDGVVEDDGLGWQAGHAQQNYIG